MINFNSLTQEQWAAVKRLIEWCQDEDPCDYDHNGYCQAHLLHSAPCPVGVLSTVPESS